jgi:hypothetical protein
MSYINDIHIFINEIDMLVKVNNNDNKKKKKNKLIIIRKKPNI